MYNYLKKISNKTEVQMCIFVYVSEYNHWSHIQYFSGFCTHSKVVFSYQLDCVSERLHDTGEKGRICMLDRKETRQSNLGISFIEL